MTNPAFAALDAAGLEYRVIRYGAVNSAAEAAAARDVELADVVKTIVTRRGSDDYVFVLIPGDRAISWPKLRKVLGVNRLSLPDAVTAKEATGYERGTITPFGSINAWPVIADSRIQGRQITLGSGEHGAAVGLDANSAIAALSGTYADVTDPEPERELGPAPSSQQRVHCSSGRSGSARQAGYRWLVTRAVSLSPRRIPRR